MIDGQFPSRLVNDELRLDRRTDYNCCSISFPNDPMFYRFRQRDTTKDWVILVIHPTLLAMPGVLFCKHNAANAGISGTPANQLTAVESLAGMFEPIVDGLSRADQRLKEYDPTDVQAEVMIPGAIDPRFIVGVVFPTTATRDSYVSILGERKPYVNGSRGLYANRNYYRTWGAGAA